MTSSFLDIEAEENERMRLIIICIVRTNEVAERRENYAISLSDSEHAYTDRKCIYMGKLQDISALGCVWKHLNQS